MDCAFTKENVSKIVALAEGADLLFIEGGFLQADAAEAAGADTSQRPRPEPSPA